MSTVKATESSDNNMKKVTPKQFLDAIFFDVPPDETVLVTKPIHRGQYKGRFKQLRPTHKAFTDFSAGKSDPVDWYFGISTVKNTGSTTLKRRKQDMCAVYCVVLDDIGTKCEVPPVTPSWILETSEGNYQYGYMLLTPVDNMQWFELFMSEVGKKGYADVGTLDSTRVMRVPLSKNIKEGKKGWLSTLTAWNPELSYDLQDLAKRFEIKLPAEEKVPRVSYMTSLYSDIELPEINDPVLDWLQDEGLIRGKQGNGYYEIQCPWHKDHTDGRDEAGYKPLGLGDEPEFRLFKCHHSHDQTTTDFIQWVHEKSGLEVGSCDRVSIDVALTQMANSMGVKAELPEAQDDNPTDTEITYAFGDVIPSDLFAHRTMVGSGKNAKICPLVTVDNLGILLGLHRVRRVSDVLSRKQHILLDGKKTTIEYTAGQIRSQAVISDFTGYSGFRDIYDAALSRVTEESNPVADWLKSITWDGESRLSDFCDLIDTENKEIRDIAVPAWLAQCVAFALGDNAGGGSVLVLSGRGGIGKTALLQMLVPEHLREYMRTGMIMSPSSKDDIAKACSGWITELGEMDGTFRRSDMAALKAFLTDEYDNYRPPYGRETLEFKRYTSFSATVNDSLFLADLTGGGFRRFWVVNCEEIHWRRGFDVEQLWAEVVHKYQGGTLSRRLNDDQALTVEQAAINASLYNDDVIIDEIRKLWPSLNKAAYDRQGQMAERLTEREIIMMLNNPEIVGCSEKEMRSYITRVRAYLKDNTIKTQALMHTGRKVRALATTGGRHLWLLPKPAAVGVSLEK